MSEIIVKRYPGKQRVLSDEERIEHIRASKTKYMVNKSWFCDVCKNNKDYKLAGKWTHMKSKKHIKNATN